MDHFRPGVLTEGYAGILKRRLRIGSGAEEENLLHSTYAKKRYKACLAKN
jgi:hypothetical protein